MDESIRVSQNFRLRGLEEWVQCKSDASRLTETSDCSYDSDEAEEETIKDQNVLYQLFKELDPYGKSSKMPDLRSTKARKPPADRTVRFRDEGVKDWTESYSDDSGSDLDIEDSDEESGDSLSEVQKKDIEDSDEERGDSLSEVQKKDIEDSDEESSDSLSEEQKKKGEDDDREGPSIDQEQVTKNKYKSSGIFSNYPEFSRYRDDIFKEMEDAPTVNEWLEIYRKLTPSFEEKPLPKERPAENGATLHTITEDSEDEQRDDKTLQEEAAVSEKETEPSSGKTEVEKQEVELIKCAKEISEEKTPEKSEYLSSMDDEEDQADTESKAGKAEEKIDDNDDREDK